MSQELTGAVAPSAPTLSVIIPTYNRKDSLLCTLESIRQQTYPAENFEVVVVDDGGNDGTDQIAGSAYPFELVYRRQINRGSAAARNHGVEQSRGSILVFIDDDMTLDPGYLTAIAGQITPGVVAMGVWQAYAPPHPSCFSEATARQADTQATNDLRDAEVPFTECTSNNLAVLRADFIQVGMWQDVLGDGPTLWGDVEFGYRAWKNGCRFARVADAKITHRDQHMTNLASATRRAYHVSRIVQPLFVLHPEIKAHLPMFGDKGPTEWGKDPPTLILRKLARQIASSRPAMWAMALTVPLLERRAPASKLLELLYRWIISGYIYRGYREGLRELAAPSRAPEPQAGGRL